MIPALVTEEVTPSTADLWNVHYARSRAAQKYPDENLVRLLNSVKPGPAFDLGTGSGRHI
ncbi:MAG: hypothetical protein HY042_11025, partial [Spirochaetia bacterium]|nr:hypothetical protein [Spirochaetia bacterium]